MKLSCLPVSFYKQILSGEMTIGQWAHLAADLGLDAIDMSNLFFKRHNQIELRKMRDEIEDAGIQVAVINTYQDFTHPEPDERKRQMQLLEKDIASARFLGAEIVRVTAGQAHPETSRKEGISWAIEGLTHALVISEQYGITLAYENHSKPGIWEFFDFSYPSDIFLEIAKGLKGTKMKILFDTANPMAYGDDPLSILEYVIDRVICIHVADIQRQGFFEPVLVGRGIVPFHEIFSLLRRSGYKEWISIEEASGLGKKGVEEAVKFVRKAWREADTL